MKQDEVYIIGGGESLIGFDFNRLEHKDTIAVNRALFFIDKPTHFVTMDYIFLDRNRKIIKSKRTIKWFIVAMNNFYIQYKDGRLMDTRSKITYDLDVTDTIILSRFDKGIGFNFGEFRHGCNSGYCGLQLAIALGYTKINLLGIDLNFQNQTHFHAGYGQVKEKFREKLEIYYLYFQLALQQLKQHPEIQIYNYSKTSELNKILPYKDLETI